MGLGSNDVVNLGMDWYALCEAWVCAEKALGTLGGLPLTLDNRQVQVPASLINWSKAQQTRDSDIVLDFSGIGGDMASWWQQLMPSGVVCVADELIKTDWCGAGLTGIAIIMVGMKEWGLTLKVDKRDDWTRIVKEILQAFKLIPTAQYL